MPRKTTKGRAANGTGSISKRTINSGGNSYTYWYARCTVGYDPFTGKQIQRTFTAKTQKEAAAMMKAAQAQIDNGEYLNPNKITVGEWFDIWMEQYIIDVKASTQYLYRRTVDNYLRPKLGSKKLQELKPATIQALYSLLLNPKSPDVKPLSPKTIKNIAGVLHRSLEQAVQLDYLKKNPCKVCKLPRVEKAEIMPFNEDELQCFLQAIEGAPHETLYKIAVFTGMRQGELLGLKWDSVDLENKTVLVKQQLRRHQGKNGQYYLASPKNGKPRTLYVGDEVVKLFHQQRAEQLADKSRAGCAWEESGFVFTNPIGSFLSYRTVYDCYKRAVTKINMPEKRFHDLRHTYAVLSLRNGDDLKTLQENLGHATASFTLDVYGHATSSMKRGAAERMSDYIAEVSNT